jgi:hypothetical protein
VNRRRSVLDDDFYAEVRPVSGAQPTECSWVMAVVRTKTLNGVPAVPLCSTSLPRSRRFGAVWSTR